MTNREMIVKKLYDGEKDYSMLMCPYFPGEQGAKCQTDKEQQDADYYYDCRDCVNGWLDSEVKE